jgi:hypothetical protein
MPRERSRNQRLSNLNWLLGTVALYACSFQDFEYLHDNHASGGKANASGGATVSNGGTGGASPAAGSGGTAVAGHGGSTTTTKSSGGESGAGADTAGAGGDEGGTTGGLSNTGGEATTGGKSTMSSGGAPQGGSGGGTAAGGKGGTAGGGGNAGSAGNSGGSGNPTLVNPSFESSLTGWTVDPADAGPSGKRYIYTQAPTDSSKPPDGSQELATWHDKDSYEVSIYQTLHGLKSGTYTFQGYFSSDRSGGTYLFARNCGGEDREEQVPTTNWTWFTHALKDIDVSGGNCEVGVRIVGAPNDYLNADMFTFTLNPDAGAGGAGGAGSNGGAGDG